MQTEFASQRAKRESPKEDILEFFRIVLKELDRTGDFTVPNTVQLRSLIAQRIDSLERER